MKSCCVSSLTKPKQMNKDFGLPVKSFVPKMIECLEDADGIVRDVAKATIIALFQYVSIFSRRPSH